MTCKYFHALAAFALAVPIAGAVPGHAEKSDAGHPETRPFDEESAALAEVAWAFARATINRRRVILVMGANWCHDSRALAGWFETSRFAEMLDQRYELVYVDVGHPQEGDGRNIYIAQGFGVDEIVGTPTVLVLSPEGALLNPETAPSWRNAASRSEDEIFDYFAAFEPE
ncbi:thioredoxin family protein [Parasphingopyxis lamellibrachiae]|uniref:Thioredoxin-like protein n=1 Tax=Parasphingopyxis lamellibrachiae TaxID=680125 RepID=A0A3D9FI82_9SPHN|nr:thioredoxin family protein [Parasphingopyxis lamellibrachiae]RED17287.1 thioredoxin-like protein [Parasphingopyxis lamellibrachiae]